MDLTFTPAEEAFRAEVREFLATNLPPALAEKVRHHQRLSKREHEQWHAILNSRGWLAVHWPVEYGGTGWTITQSYLFEDELSRAHAPGVVAFGPSMLGPVLIKYGSEAQKRHWLPRILDGSDWWCQGYSEPGAGSDLASLKTSAVREGDHYLVNGQKTWTTLGQHANMIFCLVRTSTEGRKQEGISFLLIDMKTPGIEVRPIILLDGVHEVNEIFFTNVKVPLENLVGTENKGWTYAKYLLTYERTGIAGVSRSIAALKDLRRMAQTRLRNGKPLAEDPLFAARMARVEIDLENMRTTNLRVLLASGSGAAPLEMGALLKIRGTEIRQEITRLARIALGPQAQPFFAPEGITAQYLNYRKLSIFGGSNEVQREIIGKSLLEMGP